MRASIAGMVTRIAIITLWIVAIGWGYGYLSFLFGPAATLIVLAAGIASAFVGVARMAPSLQGAPSAVEPTPAIAPSVPARSRY